MTPLTYMHLPPGSAMRDLSFEGPFFAVVVIEAEVGAAWRDDVARWLVQSGCLYMSAWGMDCSAWDDAVDWANIEAFDYGDIPDDRFVMTTWHEKDSLTDFFGFCRHTVQHPDVTLGDTLLLHVALHENREGLSALYAAP